MLTAPVLLALAAALAAAGDPAKAAELATPGTATASASASAPTATASPPAACTDFDAHVNEAWRRATDLPAARGRIGSFEALRQRNDDLLAQALADLAADPARQSTPGLRLLAAHYRSGMDLDGIERGGLRSVAPWLDRIARAERADLPALLGDLARSGIAAPLAFAVATDAKNANRHALTVGQAGLGLPDRDDYARNDATTQRLKAAYRAHAATLLRAAGAGADTAPDGATVDTLIAFETALADASMTNVQRRDPNATYNPHTPASLQALAPGLDWRALLATVSGRTDGVPVVLGQPGLARAVAQLAATAPMSTWRNYLRVRTLDAVAGQLPRALADSHHRYHGTAVRGLQARPPRVEEVISTIGGRYGGEPLAEALGELFVSRAFSAEAQARSLQMVADIQEGMRRRIQASPWMTPPTQARALDKLNAMVTKIGAPSRWQTYEGLVVRPDDHAGNVLRAAEWRFKSRLAELDQPVDRSRWNTSAHIVNAFAASGNQIVFPAGILQPPFFDPQADDATNFGAIGMVIGHEITHHFDDRGRQFDAQGNLRDWWTPADADAYRQRADRVAALYSTYEPVAGERINGRQTLGENLSDLGGMQIAFEGLQIALARQRAAGQPAGLIDGQTPAQRFFMANAVVWRTKYRNEFLVNQLRTGQHSPGRYRVLGPMSNMTAFAEAFGCQPGDRMVAADPIVVW